MIHIQLSKKIFRKIAMIFTAFLIAATSTPVSVSALLDPESISDYYSENDVLYYDPTACGGATNAGASLGGIDKFLQVLAYKESGGVLGKTSGTGAKGKYQYIDSTWKNTIKNNQMPWTNYPTANDAPESVQDAVAFIEYSKKFKTLDSDIFKLAVSHFYPKANTDESFLDIVPPGNVITPREYADAIEDMINTEGPWSTIALNYREAPGFAETIAEAGIVLNADNADLEAGATTNGLKYIKVGTGANAIPATGKKVGASVYGGSWNGTQWKSSNGVENPGEDNDDTGIGNRDNPLPGTTAYAELSVRAGSGDYSALGNLPNGTKLAISYNGRTVIAQKGDVGAGGGDVEGKPRAIDLFYDVARLLEFKNGLGVVTVRGVDSTTALTPTGGQAFTDAGTSADENACDQPCDAQASGDIVLDPGHSTPDKQGEQDVETQLRVGDNSGAPGERAAMQKTADKVKTDLEKAGYKVVMTKTKADEYVDLRKRAEIANRANAALAVSFHYDGGHEFGEWGQIYPQQVGLTRYNGSKQNPSASKIFDLADVAKTSQEYAQIFKTERTATEGHTPDVTQANFDTRGPKYSSGNIPMVQLFSKVPWIYNEVGGKGFNDAAINKYAEGITNAIKKAVKPSGLIGAAADAAQGAQCDAAANGNIVQTAINYAWPTRAEGVSKPPREGYAAAIDKFNLYRKDGRDCGEFVAAVMLGSAADPKYPHVGTSVQVAYVEKNNEYDVTPKVKSTSQLVPGMILIVNKNGGAGSSGHTLIWTGKQKGGTNSASASLGSRTGSLGTWTPLGDSRGLYTGAIKR
jgi:N-acetylmuramoyl-L-alanine amidase